MSKSIAVIGVGSAGIQSLCSMLSELTNEWTVTSISDPTIDIIGIGESTNPSFIIALERGIGFNIYDDTDALGGTLKMGTLYKNWRATDFMNPLISGNVAVHINTHKLKDFALPRMAAKWGDKFVQKLATITDIVESADKATVVTDSWSQDFDYVIDCRGFPPDMTDYTFTSPTVNHALVHNIPGPGTFNYTGHRATKDGWMFEIPLTTRTSYGYMFNNTITTVDEAKENFSAEMGIPVAEMDQIEYKFKSYYANNIVGNGRIFKNGNNAVFFEPMFANSLWAYSMINSLVIQHITGTMVKEDVNKHFINFAQKIMTMIHYHYHGGSNFDSKFWDYIKPVATDIALNSEFFKSTKNVFDQCKATNSWGSKHSANWVFAIVSIDRIDRNFGFNNFSWQPI